MTPDEIRAAVAQVDGRAELEASGGVDAQTVLVYATIEGLHYVSMGALTHSAPGLDLSLALEALPRNDPALRSTTSPRCSPRYARWPPSAAP